MDTCGVRGANIVTLASPHKIRCPGGRGIEHHPGEYITPPARASPLKKSILYHIHPPGYVNTYAGHL